MREVLLHGASDDAFDRSMSVARRLAESFGARLHVLYTVSDPLSAGWTAEVGSERMPEVHQAMESEARERLSRFISMEDQDRLNVQIAIRPGNAADEITRYVESQRIDMAILQAPKGDTDATGLVERLLDHGQCALLVLR